MTATAALIEALLMGKVVNIRTGFVNFGLSNIPREIPRAVEKHFNVTVTRIPKEGKSRYGQQCSWMDYRLDPLPTNIEGMRKMKEYVQSVRKEEQQTLPSKQIVNGYTREPRRKHSDQELQTFLTDLQNGKHEPKQFGPQQQELF